MASDPIETFTRFWSQVAIGPVAECWEYQGGLDPDGYGIFSGPGRKSIRAHRQALTYALGRPVQGFALHRCHNRRCCNPRHLYEGDAQQNINDMYAAGRERTVYIPGEQHRNAKLSDKDVADIRHALSLGHTGRSLAKRFGVTPGLVSLIKRGKHR